MFIKTEIEKYLNKENTDYAIMIDGEWGVGKTHFITHTMQDCFNEAKKRMIYISLIGLDSDETLERKVFNQINPFYIGKKTKIAKEAEYLESIINQTSEKTYIPENIVLVLDDLERINPTFFEAAMGYLNTFIEHNNTKCIFVCNEKQLKEESENYNKIKEKYIRYTYSMDGEFKTSAQEILNSQELSSLNKNNIVDIFLRARHLNLRTLLFAISIFEEVYPEIKLNSKNSKKEKVVQLLINYICFYSIEFKSGVPPSILNKITISTYKNWLDDRFEDDLTKLTENPNETEIESEESKIIKAIQTKYFKDKSIDFAYFKSVADYISTSYLNKTALQSDIQSFLYDLKKEDQSAINMRINNIYVLNDNEYIDEIKELISEAENGNLNFIAYYNLFQALIELKRNNLKGLDDVNTIVQKFKEGVKKGVKRKHCTFIRRLEYQIHKEIDHVPYKNEYNKFIEFLITENDALQNRNVEMKFQEFINAIKKNDFTEIYKFDDDSEFILGENHAQEFYKALKSSQSETIRRIRFIFGNRYKKYREHNIISNKLEDEIDFVNELIKIIENEPFVKENSERTMTEIHIFAFLSYLNKTQK